MPIERVSLVLAAIALLTTAQSALAWCFGPQGCETDDSVCDMGRDTTARIGRIKFVPAGAANEGEIYKRLGTSTILQHCLDGQVLILNAPDPDALDQVVLPELAKRFCTVAGIQRLAIESVMETGKHAVGVEFRCPITKLKQAQAAYDAAEAAKSTDTLVAEANAPTPTAKGGTVSLVPDPNKLPPECRKITFGSLLGLPGPCANKQ